jgi:hypothetical protein
LIINQKGFNKKNSIKMKKLNNLIAATKVQEYTTYYSENPQKAIWQELLLFADIRVLKRIWKTEDEDNYTYVTTSLNQAFEYYEASKHCSIKTRPLLLYYCFLNLTKGIIFIKRDKAPNSSYHGLSKPKMDSDILNTSARSDNGLFKDLLEFYNYGFTRGSIFTFQQFIMEIPELTYELKVYFDIDSKLLNIDVKHYIGGDIEIFVDKELYKSNKIFQSLLNDFTIIEENSEIIFQRIANLGKNKETLLKENIEIMKKYCVFSQLDYSYYFKSSETPIPIAASYYGVMFLLSSIVRYFPIDVSKFTIDSGENSAAWFLKHFCDIASRVYPNLMLNELMGTQIRYN